MSKEISVMEDELYESVIISKGKLDKIQNDILYYLNYISTLKKLNEKVRGIGPPYIEGYPVVIEEDKVKIGPIDIQGNNPYMLKRLNILVKSNRVGIPKYAIIEIDKKRGTKVLLAYEREKSVVGIDFGIRNIVSVVALKGLKVWKYRFWSGEEITEDITKFIGTPQSFIELEKIRKYIQKIAEDVINYIESLYPKIVAVEDLTEFEGRRGMVLKSIQNLVEKGLYYRGIKYKRIEAYATSKICSNCGYKNGEVYGSIFYCPSCGMKADRDYNASVNIALKCYYTC
ncbi:MAG: zinc ribbon domain-containing protein [Sulfolobaceae archaeon]